jgi:hypothetical protein
MYRFVGVQDFEPLQPSHILFPLQDLVLTVVGNYWELHIKDAMRWTLTPVIIIHGQFIILTHERQKGLKYLL